MRDPGQAIPQGTLAAIGTTFLTYLLYVVMTGCTALRLASGLLEVG